MTLLQHIEELRAELNGSILTRRERAQIEAELKAALARQARIDRTAGRATACVPKAAPS